MATDKVQARTREVLCTHCNRTLDIPASAMTVSCRHCHRRVIIEDVKIKAYHAVVRLATAGRVEVARNAQVVAEVRVNELVVHGNVKGRVTATDRVEVTKKGAIVGDVSCRRLSVQLGARLQGRYVVGPDFAPEPPPPDEDE